MNALGKTLKWLAAFAMVAEIIYLLVYWALVFGEPWCWWFAALGAAFLYVVGEMIAPTAKR